MAVIREFFWFLKRFWYLLLFFLIFCGAYYYVEHYPNTDFKSDYYDLYLEDDELSINELENRLSTLVKNKWTFRLSNSSLDGKIRKGLYQIPSKSSNLGLREVFSAPEREAIHVSVGNIRFRYNLTSSFSKKLDVRSRAVRRELADEDFIKSLDTAFTKENVYSIFIQDSLWIYRDATAREVVKSVFRKWDNFWGKERTSLAYEQKLTPIQVMILASIVQSESQDKEELPIIAGLYLNRLRQEMKLQADPTVVFSWGKSLRRVLKKHLRIKSKYNTYRYKGLPPGPVFTPSHEAIEAVLKPAVHDYLFFVANPELDGKHDFSETYEEHLQKAKEYRKILNRKKIYR